MPASEKQTTGVSWQRWMVFLGTIGLLLVIWLTLLPALTGQPGVASRIQHLEAAGIDPSAIFYSEIDAMPAIEEQLREQRSGDDDPLW